MRRFQSERQSLALMDHPAIAKVFDAGATPQGQPYFVMEYVPGLPITEYCDRKKLKIGDRLELFIQACEGVQHAHQKAIVHRDLKPANILVVEVDGRPMPRIIDFGLAKVATAQVGASLFTQQGHFVGTPGFMSPEQADPSSQDIDTRSDVYSLGVVLYVMLAGSLPFDTKPGQKQSLDELLRKLREEEPPETQHQGRRASRYLGRNRRGAKYRALSTAEPVARRSRLDRDEGAGEGSRPPLWRAFGTGGRHSAVFEPRDRHRASGEQRLPVAEVCAAAPSGGDRGGWFGFAAGRLLDSASRRVAADHAVSATARTANATVPPASPNS